MAIALLPEEDAVLPIATPLWKVARLSEPIVTLLFAALTGVAVVAFPMTTAPVTVSRLRLSPITIVFVAWETEFPDPITVTWCTESPVLAKPVKRL